MRGTTQLGGSMCSYQRKPAVGTKQVGVWCGSRGGGVLGTSLPYSTPKLGS